MFIGQTVSVYLVNYLHLGEGFFAEVDESRKLLVNEELIGRTEAEK